MFLSQCKLWMFKLNGTAIENFKNLERTLDSCKRHLIKWEKFLLDSLTCPLKVHLFCSNNEKDPSASTDSVVLSDAKIF